MKLQKIMFSFLLINSFFINLAFGQSVYQNDNLSWFERGSIRFYCTLTPYVWKDDARCYGKATTSKDLVVINNNLKTATSTIVNIAKNNVSVGGPSTNVVFLNKYIQGPKGEKGADGKSATQTVVYSANFGNTAISPTAYINPGFSYPAIFQTTVPGDIWETYVHNLKSDLATVTSLVSTLVNTFSINATNGNITNLNSANATTTNLFSGFANILDLIFNNATGTNLIVLNSTTTNAYIQNGRIYNATIDNVQILNGVATLTGATITDLFVNNLVGDKASITNATISNLYVDFLTAFTAFFTNLSWNNATGTNLTLENLNTTNLNATGTFMFATGTIASTSIENANVSSLLVNNSTTTNLFATDASITNATITNLSVPNTLSSAVNVMTSNVGGSISTTTIVNSNVLNFVGDAINSITSTVNGVFSSSTINTLNNLSLTGSTTAVDIKTDYLNSTNSVFTNSTTTNATTTNSYIQNGKLFIADIDNVKILNGVATLSAATVTDLFANNASLTNLISANATTTNFFAEFFSSVNAFFINLTATNATITNATTTNLYSNFANILDLIFNNATGTNLTLENLNTTNLNATGTFMLATGTIASTTINNLNAENIVANNATITNLEVENFKPIATKRIEEISIATTTNLVSYSSTTNILTTTVNGKVATTSLDFLLSTSTLTYYALRQTSNVSTTSTAFTEDPQLQFNILAGEKWFVQANINYDAVGGGSNPSIKLAISNSGSGATCNYGVTTEGNSEQTATCGTLIDTNVTGASNHAILTGVVTASGAGTIKLGFARQGGTGSPSATILTGSSLVAYRITGADLAEVYFSTDKTIEEGDVVALDGSGVSQVAKVNKKYQKNVLGIISTKPGLVMGEIDGEGKPVIVGLSGRVPVKVTNKNGDIKAGDFIAASDISGYAMKATSAGQVIGQALTDLVVDAEGRGKVMVFIKNTYHDGNTDSDTDESIADKFTALVKNTIEKLSNVLVNVSLWVNSLKAEQVNTNTLCIGETCINESDLKEFLKYKESQTPAPVVNIVEQPVSTTTSVVEDIVETVATITENIIEAVSTTTENVLPVIENATTSDISTSTETLNI